MLSSVAFDGAKSTSLSLELLWREILRNGILFGMYGTLPPPKDPFKLVLVKDGKDVDGFFAFVYSSTYSFFVSFISALRSVFSAFSVLILFSNNWCSVMLHIAI